MAQCLYTGNRFNAENLSHGAAHPPNRHRQPPLARGKVRYVGEPVVAIVAETAAAAKDASELIFLDIDEMDDDALGFLIGQRVVDRIPVLTHYPFDPVQLKNLGAAMAALAEAERFRANVDRVMETGLVLPCNHGIDDEGIGYIVEVIERFFA